MSEQETREKSPSAILQEVSQLIENHKGQEAIELLSPLMDQSLESFSYCERHACDYFRVSAIGYSQQHPAFQEALDQYRADYRSLFRLARGFNYLTKNDYPQQLSPCVDEYRKAMDTLWGPISQFAMRLSGGADNVADVFTNRYHTDDVDAFKRSHSRREALEALRGEFDDESAYHRLFEAVSAAGLLVSCLGLVNESVDPKQVQVGLDLLKEGEKLSETHSIDPLFLSRNYFDQGELYRILGEKETSTHYYNKVIDLLKAENEGKESLTDQPLSLADACDNFDTLQDPLYHLAQKRLSTEETKE